MTGVGELLALALLLLFSSSALLISLAIRRLPQDLGFLLALAVNVAVGGVVRVAVLVGLGLLGVLAYRDRQRRPWRRCP